MCNECGMGYSTKPGEIRWLKLLILWRCGADLQEADIPAQFDGLVYVKKCTDRKILVVCKLHRHLYILCRRLETLWYSSPKYNFLNVHVDAIFCAFMNWFLYSLK